MTARAWVAAAIVLLPLLGYPLFTLAGGAPRFPTREECIHSPVAGQPVDVVFERFDDPDKAAAFRERVLAVGFSGTEMLADGCGRWKVVLQSVPTIEIAREVQAEAATVDLSPKLELGAGG
jgi:hypothetical protein